MSEVKLMSYAERTRHYLHTIEGARNVRRMMVGLGWPYERAVAESVMKVCGLIVYERIAAVTEEVVLEELGVVA